MKFCGMCGTKVEDDLQTVCPNCAASLDPPDESFVSASMFCGHCGETIPSDSKCCPSCGAAVFAEQPKELVYAGASEPQPAPIAQPVAPAPAYQPAVPPMPVPVAQKKKGGKALLISLILVAVLVIGGGAWYFLLVQGQNPQSDTLPTVAMTLEEQMAHYFGTKLPASASFTYEELLYPALYQSMENLIVLNASAPKPTDMLLSVEIPGFTHPYTQQISVGPLGVQVAVLPAMLEGALHQCNIAKIAQLEVTLTDLETGRDVIHDTKQIQLQSMYDLIFYDDQGIPKSFRYICSWVTPEDPSIREWQRKATDTLSLLTEGELEAFVGYQANGNVTILQLMALYDCLRYDYGVRYNMTPVTTSGGSAFQRIMLPKDVLAVGSGLCVETAATMAAAAEALSMNAYIVFIPGHAMTIVEVMPNSNIYALIETTALTADNYNSIFPVVGTSEDVLNYLYNNFGEIYAIIDINAARRDGIRPMY